MAKTTKTTISSGFNSNSAINDNFDRIDTELNDKVLYRDNPTGQPNQMQNDLDMNSNDILNGGSAGFSSLSVNGNNITSTDAAVSTLPDQSGNSGKFLTTNGTTASWDIFVIEYDTKAAMVASTTLSSGDIVRTKGYTSIADNGGAVYIVRTAGEFGGTPDEKGDHTLGNGNVAQLIVNGSTNAYHYGAIGDGSTDDSAALQAYVNAQTTVNIPAAKFKIASSVTATSNIKLVGAGPEASEILCYSNASFVFNGGAPAEYDSNMVVIEGVGFRTNGLHTGAVVDINFTGGTGSTATSAVIDNVEVTGDATTSGFNTGISLDNARNVRIEHVRILGDRDTNAPDSLYGIEVKGNSDPVEFFISNTTIYFVNNAIEVSGTTEGLYINSCAFVAVYRGLNWTSGTPAAKPLLFIYGSHINATVTCVNLVDVVQVNIANNLFYSQNILADTGTFAGIQLTVGSGIEFDGNIANNILYFLSGATTKNGIVVLTGAGTESLNIEGNILKAFDTGILMQASTTGVRISATNVYPSTTTPVTDSGTNYRQPVTYIESVVKTLTGGAATETVDIAIPAGMLAAKPVAAYLTEGGGSGNLILGFYEHDDAASTATNARFTVTKNDSGNLPSGSIRFSFTAHGN